MQAIRHRTEQRTVELQASAAAMSGVISMGISTVCYNRQLFGPEDFEAKTIVQGMPTLYKLAENERTARIWDWIRQGINPALCKQYLSKVVLIISADEKGDDGVPRPITAGGNKATYLPPRTAQCLRSSPSGARTLPRQGSEAVVMTLHVRQSP